MTCYLDASVMLPILVKESASPVVDAFMATVRQAPWVSDFAAAEVASALSRLVRTGRLQAVDGTVSLADFDVWRAAMTRPAEIYAADVRLADVYVRRFDLGLRAPDALHLAIVRRLDATLVTLDRRLADAARELGVNIDIPS
ncbi:MAG TPA: type II toxin-antitoxin system VapC family toxin [Stellaceae bacterium]|nr:type II toxin-antitoxin system VapC family toxin [Stellaceae bacterium]